MIKNYILTFFRQFRRHRGMLFLNLTGLTVGISCAILGIMFLINEWKFDQMHENRDRIVRLYKKNVSINDGTQTLTAETSGLMGPTLADDYPEVEKFVRILPWFDETVITYGENNQMSDLVVFADSSFFDVFSFRLLRGDPHEVLKKPSSIVLTESMSKRLFGEDDPVGKTVIGLHDLEYEVTGVAEDNPDHSHIRYDALISWSTTVPGSGPLEYTFMNNWLGQTLFTYLQLAPNTDLTALEGKMQEFMKRHFEERADSYFLFFQPLEQVYMHSSDIRYARSLWLGNPVYTYTFLAAAMFVLLIACINYVNIQTARAARRAGEIGIRKVLGAGKNQLAVQFFGEAFLFVLMAALISLLFVDILLPYFNELTGVRISSELLLDPRVIAGIVVCVFITSLGAGLYPALILASFAPSATIKSISGGQGRGILSRKVLITFQYVVSIILIITSLVILSQTNYLMDKDLGFDEEQLLVMNINNGIDERSEEFRARIREFPYIKSLTASQASVGTGWFGTTIIPEGSENELSVSAFRIGADFFSTFGIEMQSGREFRSHSPQDSASLVINEALADLLGFENPLEHTIRFGPDDIPRQIIGVTRNFNYEPLNESEVRPMVMYLYPENIYNITLRIDAGHTEETLAFLEDTWNQFGTRFPFDYYFVSDWFDGQYEREERLLNTILIYAGISILLSFLGLYGLTTYLVQQRMKEFSIRKVLGATQMGITLSMNSSLAVLVLIGFVIGLPVAWWFTRDWLDGFVYQVEIAWWVYGLAGGAVLLMTVLAVSIQLWKATRTNPAEVLRNE